ncbi:NUDIX domain-containing protein [Kitasatospora sp. NPDC056181]|uniref:NUDIX domain-containing protein n=1 Tax=Kitasatospora sp. NPDC056181 TaxID=3345737 RepID=UPI0035DBCA75
MAHPPTLVVGVHLVLLDAGRVLLGRRRNTSFADGLWHLPAGHMEPGESVTAAMAREAAEELAITVAEDHLGLVHTLHHFDAEDGRDRLQLFFRPARFDGHVVNREPDKCEQLFWWPLDRLPEDTVPYTAHTLAEIGRGNTLSVLGWAA